MRIGARLACLVAFVFCAHARVVAAQSPDSAAASKRITKVREWVAATNRDLPGNRAVERDLSGFSAEGGKLSAYYAADTLRKLDAMHYGETGRAREEFYVREGEPYFVLVTQERYDRPMTGQVVKTIRTRLYFDGDRLVAWTDSTGRRREVTGSAPEEHAHDELQSFRDLLRCATAATSEACEAPTDSASR